MPRPKRTFHATAALTTTPPATLPAGQTLARVVKAAGNNLYSVEFPNSPSTSNNDGATIDHSNETSNEATPASTTTTTNPPPSHLVELPSRFRNAIWLKRGSFVVVDTSAFAERENKLAGEIVNVVREERLWRKMEYWPEGWTKREVLVGPESESEEESNMGKMPPGSEDEEGV